jgi:hypothetical protein
MPNRVLIDDGGLPSGHDRSVLTIHLDGLSDVAAALRQEVDGNLVRHITQLHSAYSMGVDFGSASHSANVSEARKVYHGCLVQVTKLLSGYVQAGEALATAIDTVVQRYGSSDAMAHARADDVSQALGDADKVTPRTDLMAVEQFSRGAGTFE